MISKASDVHNCNITSIEYNLFDFNIESPSFDEKLEQELYNYNEIEKTNNKIHMVDKTHYELVNPTCPRCGSILTSKQEWRKIKPVLPVIGKTKIWIRRYRCTKCTKKFQTNLNNFLNRFDTISHVIKDNIIKTAKKGHESLRKMAENLKIHSNIDISHQTIKNIIDIDADDEIKNRIPVYSGYYAYDEQFVRTEGGRKYRLLLHDCIFDIPIAEKIVKSRKKPILKKFIGDNTDNQPKIAIVTDHFKAYRKLMLVLGFKHQLCIFHLHQMVNKKMRKVLKSDDYSDSYKIRACILVTELREIFRVFDKKEAEKRLEKLLEKSEILPEFLKDFFK